MGVIINTVNHATHTSRVASMHIKGQSAQLQVIDRFNSKIGDVINADLQQVALKGAFIATLFIGA